jgi:tRNA threonylcarbamoyladenosine biosynthesis protein TsaE
VVKTHRIVGVEGLGEVATLLVPFLNPGRVVALSGPLGAGKTTFVRELVRQMGVDPGQVRSPTFTLVNVYTGGGKKVYHVDLYRASGPKDLESIDVEEILYDAGAVTFIEWPDLVQNSLPPGTISIEMGFVDGEGDGVRQLGWVVATGEDTES